MMSVRWTDKQLRLIEKLSAGMDKFRKDLDNSGLNDDIFDAFEDKVPGDLIAAHSQIMEGMSKICRMVEFQKMIRKPVSDGSI
jgi:hypothetical protein